METYHGNVKTPQDAIILFEACRTGLLPRVQRRLSEKERASITSGSVFVWDEREAGMRRWTDGKSWSASRVSGSFLTYREMEGKKAGNSTTTSSASRRKSPGSVGESDDDHEGPDGYRYKPDGLMKQSFSITTVHHQKLHLISYFARSLPGSEELIQPSQDPKLRNIRPPAGMYPESTVHEQQNVPTSFPQQRNVVPSPFPSGPFQSSSPDPRLHYHQQQVQQQVPQPQPHQIPYSQAWAPSSTSPPTSQPLYQLPQGTTSHPLLHAYTPTQSLPVAISVPDPMQLDRQPSASPPRAPTDTPDSFPVQPTLELAPLNLPSTPLPSVTPGLDPKCLNQAFDIPSSKFDNKEDSRAIKMLNRTFLSESPHDHHHHPFQMHGGIVTGVAHFSNNLAQGGFQMNGMAAVVTTDQNGLPVKAV